MWCIAVDLQQRQRVGLTRALLFWQNRTLAQVHSDCSLPNHPVLHGDLSRPSRLLGPN